MYRPMEQDPNLSIEEKLSKVIEWWVRDLDNIVDENIHLNAMKEIPIETRVYF